MSSLRAFILLAAGTAAGIAGTYCYRNYGSELARFASTSMPALPAAERKILYYRDPGGAPYWSATPKKDDQGRDYLPVLDDENVSVELGGEARGGKETGDRKILYYRNPMGHPDTSPVPKKDSMGMDYIPVYADEQDDPNTVKVSLDKIQRSGVRTEKVGALPLSRTVRGIGTIQHDESLLWIVTVRSDGYIEDLFVNKTGQHVRKGEPLFRFYSPQIQLAQADLLVACAPNQASKSKRAGSRRRHAEIAQSRRARQSHRRGAQEHDQPAHHRLGLACDRRHRREESHRGPTRHGRRRAVPHRRPLPRMGGRRSGRSRYRRDQGRHARQRNAQSVPGRAARRRGGIHLSGDDESRDAHGHRAHRAAQPRREAEDRNVRRCGV